MTDTIFILREVPLMIKTVGILGAGSVGSALMYEMYKRDPENVYLLARGERAERLITKGISRLIPAALLVAGYESGTKTESEK